MKVRLSLSRRYCFEGSASLSMPLKLLLPAMLPCRVIGACIENR